MNSFGRIFKVSIFGESHGPSVGVVIDGCPPGIPIAEEDFFEDLERRKGGQRGTTQRKESDIPDIRSGVWKGVTTGSPISILFNNKDIDSSHYEKNKNLPRPGHADFVANKKFKGFNDYRGGGHFSGRLTAPLVASGVIAKKIITPAVVSSKLIEAGGNSDIPSAIEEALVNGNSIGGLIECRIQNVSLGMGEPFFDSFESLISHIVFSIPAVKGIEFGAGFNAAKMRGSEFNDEYLDPSGQTKTNNTGGISGGISNGNEIIFRVAIKPTSSIQIPMETMNLETKEMTTLSTEGRHDACIALRVPPVVEACAAIVLADLNLINKCYQ